MRALAEETLRLADGTVEIGVATSFGPRVLHFGFAGGPNWHPWWGETGEDADRSLDALKEAILQAVMSWVTERLLARAHRAAEGNASPVAALAAVFMTHIGTRDPDAPASSWVGETGTLC